MADVRVHHARQGRRAGCTAARAAVLGVATALTVGLAAGCGGSHDARSHDAGAITAVSTLNASVPDRISIPSIKVDASLDTIGLDAHGALETPPFDKPTEASWFKDGPTPGEQGAAIIAGHMDTAEVAKAVFYNLKQLKKNQEIDVHRADGTTAVFVVDEVDTFKKDAFPDRHVYGKTNDAQLRLITCGGNLTKDRHWDSNVVVFAHLQGKQSA
ncbi:LPXTG-site transpeptidase (sortase) family protein [Streptacidiphilus sp. MAP12-20]|uniref:class F sortase n=1 Tax=Streptacidiphilus sp. MAP12-20 TaxID=3156299 RepID=UPI003515745F